MNRIIRKAAVKAKTDTDFGTVQLTLVHRTDGWTYEVEGVAGGRLALPWRTRTPERASRKLSAVYPQSRWRLRVLEAETVGG